jgi:predicted nuclease with TOPRIM domain
MKMIDINELRPAVEAAGLNAISMQEVLELLDRLEAAESVLKDFGTTAQEVECWLERYRCIEREAEALRTRLEAAEADALEQARLNGMGGEREAALMAKLEAAEKERDALQARIEALERQGPSVPDDVRKDAERYRFLEHLCATGSYGGIISRKAIDAAMLAASPEAKP